MRINHNIASANTNRQLGVNNTNTSRSLEKLSSGLRINRAGDDAAGLAISEKMRGQIRGLDQASRNSQDGISMIQTAEGALSETHSILQRMKELATQAANGTNTDQDRTEIQKEINQLSSEVNRIGNTTEFNTQSLLKGDGKVSLVNTGLVTDGTLANGAAAFKTQVTRTDTVDVAAADTNTTAYTINGQTLTVTFGDTGDNGIADNTVYGVTANSATVNINAAQDEAQTASDLASAFQAMIDANDTLRGNFTATANGDNLVLAAVAGREFDGAAGSISAATSADITMTNVAADSAAGTNVAAVAANTTINIGANTQAAARDLVGRGMTINGTQIEFYNANDGVYRGSAQGIDISDAIEAGNGANAAALATAITTQARIDGVVVTNAGAALTITAATAGVAGNAITVADGGIQENFKSTFQVGANQGQSFAIDLKDMRANALGITGTVVGGDAGNSAVFTRALDVTNGTDDKSVEYALDVSTTTNASNAIKVLDNAINTVSGERSKLGAYQNRLEHTINNLNTSSENLTAAESRIRDVDMAKEMTEFTKNNILTQAAQSMLAQANQQPQGVLQLLR